MAKLKTQLFERLGLTTLDRLAREKAVKERWHSLVRDIFARYYLKLREPFYSYLPPLPHRYSADWERQMKQSLDDFVEVDLQPVAELLEVCGFGTERWDQVTEIGFARLEELIDQQLSDHLAGVGGGDEALKKGLDEARDEIRKLRIGGRRALAQIKGYEEQIEQLEQERAHSNGGSPVEEEESEMPGGSPELLFADRPDQALSAQIARLQEQLDERDRTIRQLQEQIEQRGEAPSPEALFAADGGESQARLQEQLDERDRTIRQLQEQIEQLQNDLDQAPVSTEDSLLVDDDLARQNAQLRGEIRAKDHTIGALRNQIEELEKAMDSARGQLMDQVRKLGDLTSGEIALKPSEELDSMNSDELLDYAQEVAGDLDVRKQTLDEGIQGIESLRSNYDESRRFYEEQQKKFQAQLEQMSAEMESYQLQQEKDGGEADENAPKIIEAQSHQLKLLSSRITELSNTNKNLNLSNSQMYKDMEAAVKRLVPLRRQIDELESLRDTLCTFIRNKYDRTFTIKKLSSQ